MIMPAGAMKVKKTNTKILAMDGNKQQMLNDMKYKISTIERNKTPSKGIMDKLRGSRRSMVPTLKES
jgi:hypothetical protein